jgi:hypothetical protein
MRVKSVSALDELQILKACIVNNTALKQIDAIGSDAKFKSKYAQLVLSWCLSHLREYGEAPGPENIEASLAKWEATQSDPAVRESVEKLLARVGSSEINADLIADKIGVYFSRNSLNKLKEKIEDSILEGDVQAAVDAVSSWKRVEVGKDKSVDVLADADEMLAAFEYEQEALVKMQGGLGRFFGNELCRDGFIAFMGPEKRGKTFAMIEIGWRAMLQKRKVAFIGLGDMSKPQYLKRLAVRAARRPLQRGDYQVPKKVQWNADDEAKSQVTQWKHMQFMTPMTPEEAVEGLDRVRALVGGDQPLFKLAAYPNSTMGVPSIEAVLDGWARDGWEPDVIILDYADLLLPPRSGMDERASSNENWKQLRKISQERHCLVVTATQASAASYESYVVTKSMFSEDKRKLAHVTGLVGLNQTEEEKEDGIMRLNWIVRRDAAFNETECCLLAGNRAFGTIASCSNFREDQR